MPEDTKRKTMRGLGRMLAAAVLAVGTTLAAFAAPAMAAEPGDPVYIGTNTPGYGGTRIFPVYTNGGTTGTPDFWAYCIEHDVSAETDTSAVLGDFGSYLGENYFSDPAVQADVFWIISHAYPTVSLAELATAAGITGALPANDAIEGAQYAIWRFTDLTFDGVWNYETPESEAVYEYLIAGAHANAGSTPPASSEVTVTVTPPATVTAGTLAGPFTVSTNQATASVSSAGGYAITDASGALIDTDAVVDGQQIYLDLRTVTTAGSSTITATVDGVSGAGLVVSVPETDGGTATEASHGQSLILAAAAGATTSDDADVSWAALAAPAIGTTLVDGADDDQVLPWNGGTAVDTIAYTGLTPGQEYTVSGELMLQSDGSGTGITGSTTFTPTEADGSVEVTFTVPTGYAGESLVAFEYLYEGATATGTPVAEHTDIEDEAQTVTLEEQPVVPTLGTTLLDSSDDDHVLAWDGGTVVDTVAYTGLVPGTEYTVSGELMLQSDGSGTGITGSTTFTPTEADGSVAVTFTVPEGYAGESLVAFEYLYEGDTATGTPVAEHTDIEDQAQTVTVDEEPVVPTIGTTLVDGADDDQVLPWNGGTAVDTIAYTGLVPGTEYTVSGELMLQSDGSGTGITGSTTFTPTEANGSVEVTFIVPIGYAGESLVAFEYLYEGATAEGTPIAEHTDIEDEAQTVSVEEQPVVPAIGTTLLDTADQDHILPASGGTVVDTVAYTGLTPGVEYTITGELMLQSDGSATGLMSSATFTPTTADGSVAVAFTVPEGHAGEALVAFEYVYEGAPTDNEPVAVHTDIEDAAQTVTVEEETTTPTSPTTPGGGLATTGGALPLGLAGAAAAALVAGAILLAVRRRRMGTEV